MLRDEYYSLNGKNKDGTELYWRWPRKTCKSRVAIVHGCVDLRRSADIRGNRRSPVFSLTLWNVNQFVVESLPRTSNSIEGWHCGFQSSLLCTHPTLWKLLERENKLQKLTIVQLLSGQT